MNILSEKLDHFPHAEPLYVSQRLPFALYQRFLVRLYQYAGEYESLLSELPYFVYVPYFDEELCSSKR